MQQQLQKNINVNSKMEKGISLLNMACSLLIGYSHLNDSRKRRAEQEYLHGVIFDMLSILLINMIMHMLKTRLIRRTNYTLYRHRIQLVLLRIFNDDLPFPFWLNIDALLNLLVGFWFCCCIFGLPMCLELTGHHTLMQCKGTAKKKPKQNKKSQRQC